MTRNQTRTDSRIRRHVRVRNKVFGTSNNPRLNVFRSLTGIYAQLIDDDAGITLVSASNIDGELRSKMKKKSKTEQANLVGKALAERARKIGITNVVFDRGGFKYIGRVKSLADGAREGGLKF